MSWIDGTEIALNVDDKLLYNIALNIINDNEDQLHPWRITKSADEIMIGQIWNMQSSMS